MLTQIYKKKRKRKRTTWHLHKLARTQRGVTLAILINIRVVQKKPDHMSAALIAVPTTMILKTIRFEKPRVGTGSAIAINTSVFIVDETGALASCREEYHSLMDECVATTRRIHFSTTHRSFNAMLTCAIMRAYI